MVISIKTIMAVLAVLLIHMESSAVGSMKPRSTFKNIAGIANAVQCHS